MAEEKEKLDGLRWGGEEEGVNSRGYQNWGIPGLYEALVEVLQPVATKDEEWSFEEMVKKIQGYLTKSSKKFEYEERSKELGGGTAAEAECLVEEFVVSAMQNLNNLLYEKSWFVDGEVDFCQPLIATVKYTFRSGKVFGRTLGTQLKIFVDEGVFRWKEEERIRKVMFDGLSLSGLSEHLQKKALKNLEFCYNEAHMSAAYGTCDAATPELGLVQDFVRYWMTEFAGRAWEVLEEGIPGGRQDHCAFLTNAFSYMSDPSRSILPQDVIGQLDTPPPANWPFIHEQAMATMNDLEENPSKKRRTADWGGGKGGWKGGGGGW